MLHRPARPLALAALALALSACQSVPIPRLEPTPTSPPTATATPLPPTPTPRPTPTAVPFGTGPLRAAGGKLVDAGGHEVRLTGVNWSGLETGTFTPYGLSNRNANELLDQIVAAGFNTIRLPFSNQLFDPTAKPGGVNYPRNPELVGLTGPQLMDWIVDAAGRRGLRVILDRHRVAADSQTDLWYTDRVPEERWIADWVALARHYRGNPTVIGADLHNEPHGAATWGDGNPSTDWRLAAERAGNAVLQANPDWLIIVEGIEWSDGGNYWWGGNLTGVAAAPVRLSRPDRLVYSAHDYGPGVSWQRWFAPPEFPGDLVGVWRTNWAYVQEGEIAPVLVGEFGGRSVGQDTEGVWQRTLIGFLQDEGFSYTYWVWNPDGFTGGILQDDGATLNRDKLSLLAGSQWPLLGRPTPTAVRASPSRTPATPATTPAPVRPPRPM